MLLDKEKTSKKRRNITKYAKMGAIKHDENVKNLLLS